MNILKQKIRRLFLNEYFLAAILLSAMTWLLKYYSKDQAVYFRLKNDFTPQWVWYPASLMLKNIFNFDFSLLWSPLFGLGLPFFADPLIGSILPYKILLVLSPDLYVKAIIFAAGIFTYLFARHIKLEISGSLAAAIAFMFNAYFVQYLNHSQLESDVFMPMLFWLFILVIKIRKWWISAAAGLALALSTLGLSPESTFYCLFASSMFAFGLILYSVYKKENEPLKSTIYLTASIFIGVLLASFQLFPLLEYLFGQAYNYRSEIRGLTHNSIKDLYAMINYNYYYDKNFVYTPFVDARILVVMFFTGLWASIKKPTIHKMLLFTILFLVMGFCYGYLGKLVQHLPFVKHMANEKHSIPAIAFCISIFAGYGVDFIVRKALKRNLQILIAVLLIGRISVEVVDFYRKQSSAKPVFQKIAVKQPYSFIEYLKQDKDIFRIYADPRDGCAQGKFYSPLAGNVFQVFNINNISHDTVYYGYRYHKYISELIGGESSGLLALINNPELYKLPLFNLLNIKYIVGAYIPQLDKTKNKQFTLVYDKEEQGVVESPGNIKIYKNNKAFMRSFMVYNAEFAANEQQILNRMKDNKFDPAKTIIIEKQLPQSYGNKKLDIETVSKVEIESYKPTEIKVSANSSKNGFLFFGDKYYPGWKAFVDGKETEIYRANYLFRAIAVEAGDHKVEFIYKSFSFKAGLFVTILTIFICLILVLGQQGIIKPVVVNTVSIISVILIVFCISLFYRDFLQNRDMFIITNNKPVVSKNI